MGIGNRVGPLGNSNLAVLRQELIHINQRCPFAKVFLLWTGVDPFYPVFSIDEDFQTRVFLPCNCALGAREHLMIKKKRISTKSEAFFFSLHGKKNKGYSKSFQVI
ncbi:hypothetical protein NPIL_196421 [Nephila pilipes]|uniref:Uncharacterized protein n=1 Tax=Nephila pilipes TaxID=299642 RepID=A0A8X6QTX3_NEPPI|nr:hypothetical protein NPIL_196421 [Nephila pilipes]